MNDIDPETSGYAASDENPETAAQNMQGRAKQTWETVQGQTTRAIADGSEYVRKNPVPSVVGAFLLGVGIGMLLSHREEPPSARERYIEEPLEKSKAAALGLLATLVAMLKGGGRTASSAVESIAEKVSEFDVKSRMEPLTKAACCSRKRFGWF